MDAQTLIEMLRLVTAIAAEATGTNEVTTIATALEQLAGVVAQGYQETMGLPIDPTKFTFEAPLGE